MKWFSSVIWFILFMLSACESKAQEVFQAGSRNQALAGASAGLTGCWSVFGNQAGLATITRPEIAGSFENRFLINELSTRSGLFVLPVQSSVFAVSFNQFGKTSFRQEKLGIAYSQHISAKLYFGVQFNYYRLFLSEENRLKGSPGLELGVQYGLSNQLIFGFHILNPYKTAIKTYSGNFYYPSRMNIGALYKISESISSSTELENDFDRHFIVKTGLEYTILEKLYLRAGVSGKPYQLSAGIGFQVKKLTMDMATSYNQYLGNSPSVSFQYQF